MKDEAIVKSLLFVFISTGLKAVLGEYEVFTDRNTRDNLAQTIWDGDLMHEVGILRSTPRALQQKG